MFCLVWMGMKQFTEQFERIDELDVDEAEL
jgi:hypothetical protein